MRQIEFLAYVLGALDRLQIPYVVVGSYASATWGEPRLTRDVDIVVDLSVDQVDSLCGQFPEHDFYLSRAAANEAVQRGGQFNLIHPASGNKIDFMIAGPTGWAQSQLSRRQKVEFAPTLSGYVATPEDIILGKLIYYREGSSEKHIRDIRGIIKVSGEELDREYIRRFARELHVADIWARIEQTQ